MCNQILSKIGELTTTRTPRIINSSIIEAVIVGFVNTINRITIIFGLLGGVFIAGIAALMLAELIARNTGTPLVFSWEYSTYLMAAAFFMSSGFTLMSAGHVRVSLFTSENSAFRAYVCELLCTVIGLAVISFICWSVVSAWLQLLQRGTVSYTVMKTPMWLPVSLVAAGCVILFLQCLARLLGLFIGQLSGFRFATAELTEG